MVITEIVESEEEDVASETVAAAATEPDTDEGPWSVVVGRRGRAQKVQLAPVPDAGGRRVSSRLAKKEPENREDMLTKAVKVRELRESLKGCSVALQNQIGKTHVLKKLSVPLGMKAVFDITRAAFGRGKGPKKSVPAALDD
ncbi:hypothetical protein ACUV84_043094 [Puccinellia chinampoensis]